MPDFKAQFRNGREDQPHVYMGGSAMSCGQHPTLPKRHQWGPWEERKTRGGYIARERTCTVCGLVSDATYRKEHKNNG